MSDPRYQIDVSVVTRYLAEQSQPEQNRYAFAYTVTGSRAACGCFRSMAGAL